MDIAVCIPSRGLIYSEVMAAIWREVAGHDGDIGFFYTHNLPIPDCFNYLAEQAMNWSFVWFVEEDTVPPAGALKAMIEAMKEGYMQVAIDYPVCNGISTVYRSKGRILFTGLGCTLINTDVFTELPYPWFETSKSYQICMQGGSVTMMKEVDIPYEYGGNDVAWGLKLNNAGYRIGAVKGMECRHLKLKEPGKVMNNDGCHRIMELPRVTVRHE